MSTNHVLRRPAAAPLPLLTALLLVVATLAGPAAAAPGTPGGEGPTVMVPRDLSAEATGPDGAVVAFTVTATTTADGDGDGDGDGTAAEVDCDAEPGVFALGTTLVTCRAVDDGGRATEATFTVTVRDTTGPSVTLRAAGSGPVEATGPTGARATFVATATDLVDGDVTVFCSPTPGAPIDLGSTVAWCAASDLSGNVTVGPALDLVVVDTTGPELHVPTDLVHEATGPNGRRVVFAATASDLVDGPVPPTCGPASGLVFPLGETTVNCNAVDGSGNPADPQRFSVTVRDTLPPVVVVPRNRTVAATGPDGVAVSFDTLAVDLVDGASRPSCDHRSGTIFPVGVTVVTCTGEDGAGNLSRASFEVTVSFAG